MKRFHSHKNGTAWKPQPVVNRRMLEVVDTAFYNTGRLNLVGSTCGHETFVINLNDLRLCKTTREMVLAAVEKCGCSGMLLNNTKNSTVRRTT